MLKECLNCRKIIELPKCHVERGQGKFCSRVCFNKFRLKKNVGYFALHSWIRVRKSKPKFCERCQKNPPRDLANISGHYRREISDFEWLCRKCHMIKDGRIVKRNKQGRFGEDLMEIQ